jgi:hypothetical protein
VSPVSTPPDPNDLRECDYYGGCQDPATLWYLQDSYGNGSYDCVRSRCSQHVFQRNGDYRKEVTFEEALVTEVMNR